MSFIHIKKIQQYDYNAGVKEVYAVPAMAIVTPQGRKLIPNPSGQEASLFDTLEEAQDAIRRAGFDYVFEGKKTYTLGQPTEESGPPPSGASLDDAVPFLTQRLKDREASVVANAAFALGALRATTALPALAECLGHDDPAVRKHVAEAMARMGGAALSFLNDAFRQAKTSKEKNAPYVRLTVMTTFAELAQLAPHLSPQFLPLALEGLNDDSWLVRSQAALVIGFAANAREREDARFQPPA